MGFPASVACELKPLSPSASSLMNLSEAPVPFLQSPVKAPEDALKPRVANNSSSYLFGRRINLFLRRKVNNAGRRL
jgi:hypothetical protein